jgi:hypothetical protein
MTCFGFEPRIAASERAKTVHALDRSASVTGIENTLQLDFLLMGEYMFWVFIISLEVMCTKQDVVSVL